MPTIKIHLDQAEYDVVARFAAALKLTPEAIAYGALDRVMLDARDPMVKADLLQTWASHRDNLPLWADSSCSPHPYESKPDEEPEPSRYL